jgi:hypothetical protein
MLLPKALKEFPDKKYSKPYEWWIQSKFVDWIYDFKWKWFGKPIFQIKRLYQWHMNVFRFDYDFDFHCMFAIIEYKLKRIEKCLIDGNAFQDPKDIKAIKLAIKLADRLKDDNYPEAFYKRHDRKWGKMKTWFTPCNDGTGCSTWNHSRPKANTPKLKEQESKEHLASMHAADAKAKREEKRLYDILHKYGRSWWD